VRVLREAGATRYAFLGDYLGRGDSDACVERIKQVADVAIVGNRDLDWQDRVSAASKTWVLSLPRTAAVGKLLVSHGDPRLTPKLSTSQIGRDFQQAWGVLDEHEAAVWAFGHSHNARLWRKRALAEAAEAVQNGATSIEPGWRYVLNVGTTGLPFPGKGGPSVALVDFANRCIRQLPIQPV
jgi:predicted phosphodiesterase